MRHNHRTQRAVALVAVVTAALTLVAGGAMAKAKPTPQPTTPVPTKVTASYYRSVDKTLHLSAWLTTVDQFSYVDGETITFVFPATAATPETPICSATTATQTITVWGPPEDEEGFAQCTVDEATFARALSVGFTARFGGDASYLPSEGSYSLAQLVTGRV